MMRAQGEVSVAAKREWRAIQTILSIPLLICLLFIPGLKPGCSEAYDRAHTGHDHHKCVEVEVPLRVEVEAPKKQEWRYRNIVIVLPEDGCSQERDCECGVCPPY